MGYKYQADWQPYAYSEDNAFLTSDQTIESMLADVDTMHVPFLASGIPLHVVNHHVYVNNNTENTIIFGETDSMKTRSAVRPMIAMAAGAYESMIVTDVKGELSSDAKLRSFLDSQGYRTVFIDFRTCASDGYNVLEYPFRLYCSGMRDKAMACIAALISALSAKYGGSKADPFWEIMSSEHLMSIIQILFEVCAQKKQYQQYVNMLTLSTFTNEDATMYLTNLVENYLDDNSSGMVNMLRGVLSAPDKTRASIVATTASLLKDFVIQEKLLSMLSISTFDVTDLYCNPTIIFMMIPDETSNYDQLAGLLIDQFYTQLIDAYTHIYQNRCKPRCRINLICDEFCNLKINDMRTKISISRSRQMRWYIVCQSKAQLEATYPQDAATIIGNCKNLLFLQSSDPSLLEYISRLSGMSSIGEPGTYPQRILPEHLRKLRKAWEYKEAIYLRDDVCYKAVLPDIDQYGFLMPFPSGFCPVPAVYRRPVVAYTPQQLLKDLAQRCVSIPFRKTF